MRANGKALILLSDQHCKDKHGLAQALTAGGRGFGENSGAASAGLDQMAKGALTATTNTLKTVATEAQAVDCSGACKQTSWADATQVVRNVMFVGRLLHFTGTCHNLKLTGKNVCLNACLPYRLVCEHFAIVCQRRAGYVRLNTANFCRTPVSQYLKRLAPRV